MSKNGVGSSGRLQKDAGLIGLLFASTTCMIGSGWLFGAFHAAKLAGPWSIVSWVLGAALITLIALCFAELATVFPRSGALVHMSHASHGAGLGRVWGWLLFLAYVVVPAVEAEAVVTYANSYWPVFLQPASGGLLTSTGMIASIIMLGVFALLNTLSVRWLLNFNTAITWWKLFVPLLVVAALLSSALHPENFAMAPDSYSMVGIFTALPTAGVAFSFLGFRTAIDLAGETSNPSRNLPIAVIGSLGITALIYVVLQVAFLLALPSESLAAGWDALSFAQAGGPFAVLAMSLGMTWLAGIIYVDAYVSPAGTGWMMMTGGSRVLMANGELRAGPRWLSRLNGRGVPWVSVLLMWLAGCVFFLPFPAWQQMVGYVSAITVLTFGLGPVVLICLRRNLPDTRRPFRLPGAGILAPAAFIASNWIVYWTGYATIQFLFALLAIGFVVYALYYHFIARQPAEDFGWRQIAWLLPWFGGMWLLSGLGSLGGLGILSFGQALVVIAVWSLIVLWIARATALSPEDTKRIMSTILATQPQADETGQEQAATTRAGASG